MKAVNITLSILVLLMALASAVFSYFLFEKRSELVTGWGKMALTINTASRELDKNSGTRIAEELAPAKLAHENYAALDELLKKLPDQSRQIIGERDALADALLRIGRTVKLNPSENSLRNLATYNNSKNAIVLGVNTAISNRDKTNINISSFVSGELKAGPVSREKLESGDRSAFDGAVKAVRGARERRSHYESQLRAVASQSGISGGSLSFDDDYRAATQKVTQAVSKLNSERRQLRNDLSKAQSQNRRLTADLSASKRNLEAAQAKLAENGRLIAGYQKALNLVGPDLPMPWLDGSKEARAQVLGHVVKVDTDYGYVAVDLGTSTRVKQKLGDKFLDVDPRIAPKDELVVARGDLSAGNAEFIARIELDKVGTECSTADLPADAAKKIKVGDIVYIESAR